jgi:hypothetical protein
MLSTLSDKYQSRLTYHLRRDLRQTNHLTATTNERNNRGTVGSGVLCWVRAESIYGEPTGGLIQFCRQTSSESSASLPQRVADSGDQKRLGVYGQELRP